MPAELFVDTNILVYAHDRDAGGKHETAKRLVAGLWREPPWPSVSVQVLQEFYVNLYRKGVAPADARETIKNYAAWRVVDNTVALLDAGIEESARWGLSFRDGLILAAARPADATVLYSEGMSSKQDYAGIRVENPFAIDDSG